MVHRFDGPIRLDDRQYNTAEALRLSGVGDRTLRNWIAPPRCTLTIGERHFTGRIVFTLLEIIQLAAMDDLTRRVPLKPSDAAGAALLLARHVAKHSAHDADGHPIADPNAISPDLAFVLAVVDGEMQVGLIDPTQPEYRLRQGTWSRAHVVLPIAALVADVLFRLVEMATAAPEGVS